MHEEKNLVVQLLVTSSLGGHLVKKVRQPMLQAECEEFVPSLRLIGDEVCQGLDCFLNDWQALKGANTGNEGSNASPTLTTDRADLFIFAEAQIDQDMDRFFFNLVDMLLESFKLCLIH